MKRNILLTFTDEDDYADVLIAIRAAHAGSTKDPAERGAAIAEICRCYPPPAVPLKVATSNGRVIPLAE